jgi:hypothetical protein
MKLACLSLLALGLSAQMRDNTEKTMRCDNRNRNGDHARSCKITEQTIGAMGRLTIDAGHNGGVTVKGWSQGQTLVRAKVEAWAPSDSEAALLASQVRVDFAGGTLRSSGPENIRDGGWAVSWEVFTPHRTDLRSTAHNGGIHVTDLSGRLEMNAHNGGVHLSRVAGDVTATTHNGGIHVELLPNTPNGQLAFDTHNGGIHLALPQNAAARVHAETNSGGIHSAFPVPELHTRDRRPPRNIDFTIGGGGPSVNLKTHNGGVHIQKL